MRKMSVQVKSMVLLLLFVLSILPASGENTAWDCPECGRTGNTSNYCGNCAHPAPWMEKTQESMPAAETTAEPTPEESKTDTKNQPGEAPIIEQQPASQAVADGRTAVFRVKAKGAVSYQWQHRANAQSAWVTREKNTTDEMKIKVTSNHDGYQYRCLLTSADGTVVESDSATLTFIPLVFGFDLTAEEYTAKMTQLLSTVSKWTKKTAPQTLDKFPIMPKQMDALFAKTTKATSTLKKSGNVYTWTSNIDDMFKGTETYYSSDFAVLGYTFSKGKYWASVNMNQTKAGTYQVDLAKAEFADGQTVKSIKIDNVINHGYILLYGDKLSCRYDFFFYPKGRVNAKKESRSMTIWVTLNNANGHDEIQWTKSTFSNEINIRISRLINNKWHDYYLNYNTKTKKLASFRK